MHSDYPEEYLRFIELFNDGDYFEAHEVLEELWQREQEALRAFYQGLIQVAAIFVHLQEDTPKGCPKILGTCTRHLESFRPFYMGLDLDGLLERTREAIDGSGERPRIQLI